MFIICSLPKCELEFRPRHALLSLAMMLLTLVVLRYRPHYRLEAATKALQAGLEEAGQIHLYKRVETLDFTQEIIKQFNDNWFFIDEEQVVRE